MPVAASPPFLWKTGENCIRHTCQLKRNLTVAPCRAWGAAICNNLHMHYGWGGYLSDCYGCTHCTQVYAQLTLSHCTLCCSRGQETGPYRCLYKYIFLIGGTASPSSLFFTIKFFGLSCMTHYTHFAFQIPRLCCRYQTARFFLLFTSFDRQMCCLSSTLEGS